MPAMLEDLVKRWPQAGLAGWLHWPQRQYLGVCEVDPMIQSIGRAPRKGDHSGSPKAIPADSCERRHNQEAPKVSNTRQGVPQPGGRSPAMGHPGTSKKEIWLPKPKGHCSGNMATPSLPKFFHKALWDRRGRAVISIPQTGDRIF